VFAPVSITFIQCVLHCAVRCSVSWKPAVAEVDNLLLNVIALALSILLVKLTSGALWVMWVLWVLWVLYIAGWTAKSEDSCDVSEPLTVTWFNDYPSQSEIVHCTLIVSDAWDAASDRVLLQMCANILSVHIEVNVNDNEPAIFIELTTTWASHRAALIYQSCTNATELHFNIPRAIHLQLLCVTPIDWTDQKSHTACVLLTLFFESSSSPPSPSPPLPLPLYEEILWCYETQDFLWWLPLG